MHKSIEDSIRKMQYYIVENSNYSIDYIQRINIFEMFKLSELIELKIQAKINAQEESNNKNRLDE